VQTPEKSYKINNLDRCRQDFQRCPARQISAFSPVSFVTAAARSDQIVVVEMS
jgi:hypothetical protein